MLGLFGFGGVLVDAKIATGILYSVVPSRADCDQDSLKQRYVVRLLILIAVSLVFLSRIHVLAAAEQETESKSDTAPLYLHVFTPNPDGSNETLHLMTVRFRPSEEIDVITKWSFSGRIEERENTYVADLKFSYNGGVFEGEVEVGKRYETTFLVSSPTIRLCSFAITHLRDPGEFVSHPYFRKGSPDIDNIENNPTIVEQDSPSADSSRQSERRLKTEAYVLPPPTDVNQDGHITAVDVLIVINAIDKQRNDPEFVQSSDHKVDVNGDGEVTAIDALTIIKELNEPGRDTAVALSTAFLSSNKVDWEIDSVGRRDDGEYIVYYVTPLQEARLRGHRATAVDIESRAVRFLTRK